MSHHMKYVWKEVRERRLTLRDTGGGGRWSGECLRADLTVSNNPIREQETEVV